VLIRDMTEQLNMERLLRDNESRLRAIADNVPAVIAFFDGEGALQYSNFAYDRWFGDPGESAGAQRSCSEGLAPLLDRALQGDEVTTERVLDTRAGPRVARLTLIPHRKEEGGVEGAYLMGYDLTDFRRAEAEVRHLNAELEQRVEQRTRALAAANRELESFSYSVSHDLRAPLRTIDGFSQILIDEYADVLDEAGKGYLERVRAGSQRMAKLIDDLLELARVTRRDRPATSRRWRTISSVICAVPNRSVRSRSEWPRACRSQRTRGCSVSPSITCCVMPGNSRAWNRKR